MAKMNGVDISKWQAGLDPRKIPADFIIVRATYGIHVIDPYLKFFAGVTLTMGKPLGIYHFATGEGGAVEEAKYFLKQAAPYVGKALLILDWEGAVLPKGPGYAKEFCDYVFKETGVIPILYGNTSTPNSFNWKEFQAAGYRYFWGAEYGPNNDMRGYNPCPPNKHLSTNGFKEIIRQYSSHTYLDGYDGRLDANEAYIDKYEWANLCKKVSSPSQLKPKPDLSIEAVGMKIMMGQDGWGVKGQERITKLEEAGYNYEKVQAYINKTFPEIQAGKSYYVTNENDSMVKIINKYNLTVNQIKELNPELKNTGSIKAGTIIRVK